MTRIRRYSELRSLKTFEERYEYLRLDGRVGNETFGYDRWINQEFYASSEWKRARNQVIARDMGCDLGIEGYEIFDKVFVHHMNPMDPSHIIHSDPSILDPENLITVTHNTHNAIHYGDKKLLRQDFVERKPGDTRLWGRQERRDDGYR